MDFIGKPPLGDSLKLTTIVSGRAGESNRFFVVRLAASWPQGRFALIDDPKMLDIVPFKRKSISIHWELMFTRSLFQTADIAEQGRLLNEVSRLVDDGTLRTTRSTGGQRLVSAAEVRRLVGVRRKSSPERPIAAR